MANEIAPTRQSIAANMYALRAGLSVVSQEVDIATAERDAANNKKQNVQNSVKTKLNNCKQAIKDTEDEITQQNDLLAQMEREQYTRYSSAPFRSFIVTSFAFALLSFTIGVVIYMICSWIFFNSTDGNPLLDKWFGWYIKATGFDVIILLVLTALSLGATGLAIFLVYRAIANFHRDLQYNRKVKEKRKNARTLLNTIPQNIISLKKQLAEQKTALTTEQNRGNLMLAEAKAAHKKALAQTIATHVQPAKAVYKSLLQIFSNQIDERDWANLDYLIYAIETGRAESIKESLQLLDKEKQTDRIVAAIQTASKEIAQSLQRGFSALSEQMTKSFVVLSKQIQNNTDTVLRNIGQVQGAQAETSARILNLTAQQTLTNALLEKASESSEQLVEDVHRIAEW